MKKSSECSSEVRENILQKKTGHGYKKNGILSHFDKGIFVNLKLLFLYNDLVPKGVHENRTKGVENKVDDTLKLVVFLECAQC